MSSPRANPVLNIDKEFENRIPPLTDEEFQQLEQNILSEGIVLMPLIVWSGTIIDGHNRYKIAQAHPEVIFTVYEKDFDNRYEALAWICNNQLGRRNLTPIQKKTLVGDRYGAEKMAHGGDRKSGAAKSTGQNGQLISDNDAVTRRRIAEETGTSESYVKRADQFSRGVSAAEEVSPGFRQEVLSGKIQPTQKEMWAIARASPKEREMLIKNLKESAGDSKDTVPEMTAQDAVQQFEWKVTRVLQNFDNTFREWPQLITEETYRQQVLATLQDLKIYIQHIEGGTRYEWDHESRKISV